MLWSCGLVFNILSWSYFKTSEALIDVFVNLHSLIQHNFTIVIINTELNYTYIHIHIYVYIYTDTYIIICSPYKVMLHT